jgi:hypothetical protein
VVKLIESAAPSEPDGSLRIVVADADPGASNWLDSAGHRHGALLWRWNDAPTVPPVPRVRIVDLPVAAGDEI